MKGKSKWDGFSNEELIIDYALTFCRETKKGRKQEQVILKELVNRGIIDKDKINELYKRKALSYDDII